MPGPRLRRILLALAVPLLLYLFAVLALQRMMIFPRGAAPPVPNAGAGIAGLEKLWLETDEGRVEAWFLPGEGVSPEKPGPLVVFAHGNAELIDYWPEELAPYRAMGVSVLLPEYRGYGRSAGNPSEDAIASDFLVFFDRAVARPDVDRDRVILHGRSLGGGALCNLARERPPAAMVLQSTFTSIPAVARRWLVPSFLVRDRFDNLACLRGLDAPVLIIHGRRDNLIPPSHAEALAHAARDPELVWYDADHNDCPPDWPNFWRRVEQFLQTHALSGATRRTR